MKEGSFMKKVLAILLALLLLAGCGAPATTNPATEAPEAPEAVVTQYMTLPEDKGRPGEKVELRPGKVVEVNGANEFVEAYQAMYKPQSNVAGIRLMSDFSVYNKTLRTDAGNDPWMSGFEGTLCVRMPEGTCLDLNGHKLALRANQGLDDNGTGTPSGDLSLGKIVDTLLGGELNLYIIPEAKYLDHALKVAAQNPEFVRTISISEDVTDAQDSEYIIPEHICLKFSGKNSAINAKCVTFRPTATAAVAYDTAVGLGNTAKVVFEYQDDADKTRAGSEFATETVAGAAATALTRQEYYIEEDEQSVSVQPVPVAEPPIIDNCTVETTEAAVLRNITESAIPIPEIYTVEQKQQAVVESAFAYYYHNPDVQYDGRCMVEGNKVQRVRDNGTPEMAEIDTPVYSVCSNFAYKTYVEAFDYRLLGKANTVSTTQMTQIKVGDPVLVYKYGEDGEKDLEKALVESRKLLQPGDIITGYGTSGHAMVFVGDALGDGKEYVIHCWGKSYTKEDGMDYHEAGGSIKLQDVDYCCYTKGANSPQWYLGDDAHMKKAFTIYRPINDPNFPAVPTQSAAMRLVYPRIEIRRVLDRNQFLDAMTGEEIPVTVTVTNHSTQDYMELPVLETLPEGQTYVEGSASAGAKPENGKLLWNVKIPAGKSIALTYKVRLDAKQGETVVFPAGTVGGIPSREAKLTIGGAPLTKLEEYGIKNCAKAMSGTKTETFEDIQFFVKFYKEAIGMDIELPQTTGALLDAISEKYENGDFTYRRLLSEIAPENAKLKQMIMPLHFTGQRVENDGSPWSRVREHRYEYYKPGDLFIGLFGTNTADVFVSDADIVLYMYVGEGSVLKYDTDGTVRLGTFANTIGRIMNCNVLIGLRPTLVR